MPAAVAGGPGCAFELARCGPVGLAAGFDRDGTRIAQAAQWGFGFVELGTVTPAVVADRNPGAAALAAKLARLQGAGGRPIVGVNLGLQPGSKPDQVWRDYVQGMQAVWDCADYLVLNLTSDAARQMHQPGRRHTLLALLERAAQAHAGLAEASGLRRPLLIKWPVAPALDDALAVVQRARAFDYAGVVAAFAADAPGDPAWDRWVPRACAALAQTIAPATLVAVGGIDSPERALALRTAGAQAVQLYRAFVAQGPPLVRSIARAWTLDAPPADSTQPTAPAVIPAAARHAERDASGRL